MGWYDAPISPEHILAGAPHTRAWDLHSSREGGVSMNYWDCTAGHFTWHYPGDEFVQILEGEVHITDAQGVTRTLRAGDTDVFRAGETLTWHVPRYVRKLAFHRSAQTLADRLVCKAMRLTRMRPARPALGAATAVGTLVALPL
jgi:uncharacterized cupin superfamily protein